MRMSTRLIPKRRADLKTVVRRRLLKSHPSICPHEELAATILHSADDRKI